ncbi:MAG: hypothetical protein WC490_07430 [Candidatus Margulisiibacteriota bacterium]
MNKKNNISKNIKLLKKISEIGKRCSSKPIVKGLFPFEHYLSGDGSLKNNKLDRNDGLWTRREIVTRYLLMSAVLDQGPDMAGVRRFVKQVVNALYKREVRIFHKPLEFFREIGISIDQLIINHERVKRVRSHLWANANNSNAAKYNLFIDGSKQVLGYAVYRWGVPLCVPLLLEKEQSKSGKESFEPLVDYIESWPSAEVMSQEIKDNKRYGLGKAIGDKAAHLFAKWYIHSYGLAKRKDESFGALSYELPFDSNAGRVLFRTGFLLSFAALSDYEDWEFIQKGEGKGGEHYLRITNLRGKKVTITSGLRDWMERYCSICLDHLKVRKRKPSKIELQQLPNLLLLGTEYGIGDLDDGLMHIGTKYCFNHASPKCGQCPIKKLCYGNNGGKKLVARYRT